MERKLRIEEIINEYSISGKMVERTPQTVEVCNLIVFKKPVFLN